MPISRSEHLQRLVVTADQMRAIEARVFAAGMPVAALMEKVAGLITRRIMTLYPPDGTPHIGVLVGPGHNGGDALVVARELHFQGYHITLCCPCDRLKELTATHLTYARSLGIPCHSEVASLQSCDLLIDGLFGFGLEKPLTDPVAPLIQQVNSWQQPVLSIDLPSGLHTDTGEILGTAIRADRTLCLGLWKVGLLQEEALETVGTAELIDFDLPLADILTVIADTPAIQRVTSQWAIAALPLPRPATTHKYKMGHLLLVCGSRQYAGGALLTGLGARASGVGMLSIAVPDSLKTSLSAALPDALILGCPETPTGAIAQFPPDLDLDRFDAIACGPGLTPAAIAVVQQVLSTPRPLVLDADGLNILSQQGTIPTLQQRQAPTVLTPHLGEFKRLFPDLASDLTCRATAVRLAAAHTGAIVLLKGARVAIGHPQGEVRINPASTPALARGGSGDVLTGLMGGLLAQTIASSSPVEVLEVVQTAAWWHAQAGIMAAAERTELGVDAHTLTDYLIPVLRSQMSRSS